MLGVRETGPYELSIGVIALLVIWIFGIFHSYKCWTSEPYVDRLVARGFNGRGALGGARAAIRTSIPLMIVLTTIVVEGVVVALGVYGPRRDGVAILPVYGAYGGVACFAISYAGILFYNRPKFLVPPHMRDDLGLWQMSKEQRAYVRKHPGSVPPRRKSAR